MRKVQKKEGEEWVSCKMMELRIGDVFRVFEPDGERVYWDNAYMFLAIGDPYINEQDISTISCEKVYE